MLRALLATCSYDNLVWDITSDSTYAAAGLNKNDGVVSLSLPGSATANDTRLSCGGRNGC